MNLSSNLPILVLAPIFPQILLSLSSGETICAIFHPSAFPLHGTGYLATSEQQGNNQIPSWVRGFLQA